MKTDTEKSQEKADISGMVVAVILILIAALAIWDTTDMTDADSFVFPRAIAISMISFCTLFIVRQMISPSIEKNDEAGGEGGSTARRIGLVLAMIVSSLLMPWLGFLISGILAFGSIMMLAMYDEWTLSRRLVFPLAGIVIVIGFYFMFAELLLVPLPVGTLFE
ncbi:MAG: tripartite tricarboxylate transporter TctB family protein [Gammaproteobacteria bacterium]|nr:tripartite tricarboxylate transporter TctB family protein [Gammaproteobacteria bacterium]